MPSSTHARRLGTALAAALAAAPLTALPAAAADSAPFISEIHYDTVGTDTGEAIEVEAPEGVDLTGWKVVLYNGANGQSYNTQTLGAGSVVVVRYPSDGVQNGAPDGVALVRPDGTVAEFLSYEGAFTATNGPASGMTSTDIGVAESNSTPGDQSLQKVGGAWTGPQTATFGTRNGGTTPPVDPPVDPPAGSTTDIEAVQGTGATSPLAGQTVTVEGVVTADHETGGFAGVYVQQTDGDDPAASDAVFVYKPTTALAIGDRVRVTGAVSEFGATATNPGSLTEITASAVTVLESGAALPAAAPLDGQEVTGDEREALEGMLVAPAGEFTVSEVYNLNRYGEVLLAPGSEPFRNPTDVARPGSAEAKALQAEYVAEQLLLDDGSSTNLSTAGRAPSYGSPEQPLRVGDTVASFGAVVLDFRNSAWKLQPTTPVTPGSTTGPAFAATNPRPAAPGDVGGDLQVSSFNVLNYFTTLTSENSQARGAATRSEFLQQQAKIVAAINGLGAEVVSLEEIENSAKFGKDRDSALAALVEALNADAGAGTWAFVPSPAAADLPPIGDQDYIRTAFIYQPAAVETVGASVVDTDDVWAGVARQPLAQTFSAEGREFTVVVNHFKSKGSGSGVDADQGDGQGASNNARVQEARRLDAFVDEVTADAGTTDVLLLGDFNAYTQEDPMQVLYEAGYTDLNSHFETGKSSYVFSGQTGSLDHALASESILDDVTGVDIWNINASESIAFEYGGYEPWFAANPYRSSDHDPILIGLDLVGDEVPTGPVDLQLLDINDFHGRIGGGVGVRLAGTVEEARAKQPNTIFVSAGDNIGASTFVSSSQQDEPTIDVLNALGLQASAVGNHEFDQGLADLTGRVEERADWPYLGANVYGSDGEPVLPEYAIVESGGLDVGFIGVVTRETPSLVTPTGVAGLTFGDEVEAANRVAAELSDGDDSNGEADVLVLLAHDGATESASNTTLADQIALDTDFSHLVTDTSAEVDVIFTGHTHKEYVWEGPVPGSDRTRPVVQTGEYGNKLGQVLLSVDPATGEVLEHSAANIPATTTPAATLVSTYPRVAEVDRIVRAAEARAAEVGNVPVGRITGDINRGRTAAGGEDRSVESPLGHLVADAMLAGAAPDERGGAQIGITNPGGLRADLRFAQSGTEGDGVVTVAEANTVLPFANNLVTVSLTGAQLVQVLEQQWQPTGSARPYLALGLSGNVRYSYVPDAPAGQHVVASTVTVDGKPLDPAATYKVATNNFLAAGGDNFTAFRTNSGVRDSGLIDFDALRSYLETRSPISPDTTSRASVYVAPAPASDLTAVVSGPASVKAGSRATYTLTVTNTGNAAATGVGVAFGTTGLSGTSASPRGTAGNVVVDGVTMKGFSWTTPTLAAGQSLTYTISGKVSAAAGSSVTAKGFTRSSTEGTDAAGNSSSTVSTVTR